ncbi:C1 family peptidase [Glaciecola sp. 2405UD65-10]|uniref:C1 family peptidase n=1 Tax=Glaciecola sp. 2405UD65-10 TaxID=3397244 RepID=UPI003B5B3A67
MNKDIFTPIDELNFASLTRQHAATLKRSGIATFAHLNEALRRESKQPKLYGIQTKALREDCMQYEKKVTRGNLAYNKGPIIVPPMGMVLDAKDSPTIMQRRQNTQSERLALSQLAQSLEDELPKEYLLNDLMQDVRNQQYLGSCTGFGSINSREFLVQLALSPGFAYRGAKMLDGYPYLEGSWQEFAFEFMVKHGAVLESEYPYEMCLNEECIEPYLDIATTFAISSYVDLMVEHEYLVSVLKAALSGYLMPELGPQPVSISVAVYESFCDYAAYSTGLIPVPLASEKQEGGHAMCVCRYTSLYGVDYFLVINSWGKSFAQNSPLGLPGYALIPAAYIATPGLVGELLMPLE